MSYYRPYYVPEHVPLRYKLLFFLFILGLVSANRSLTAVDVMLVKMNAMQPEQCAQQAKERETWDFLARHCGSPIPKLTPRQERWLEEDAQSIARMRDWIQKRSD